MGHHASKHLPATSLAHRSLGLSERVALPYIAHSKSVMPLQTGGIARIKEPLGPACLQPGVSSGQWQMEKPSK